MGMGMGMNIGSSSAAYASQGSSVNGWQQRQSNFHSLKSALQTGDLASAQSAFAAISANNPNISSTSPLGQIGAALSTGDLKGAQQISSSMQPGRISRERDGDTQISANSAANATGTAFLNAFLGAISPTASPNPASATSPSASSTGASEATSPIAQQSIVTNTSLGGTTSPSTNQIAQDVTSFLQNLFTSLEQGALASAGPASATNSASSQPTSTASSALSGLSGSAASLGTQSTQPYNPAFRKGYGGALNQLSKNLQSLISQLEGSNTAENTESVATSSASSSTNTASLQNTSTTPISQLQQSFGTLISDAGGTPGNSSLASFLQNFEQNLQNNGTTGSFINMSA